jgi:hypothetical protein
MTQQLLHPSRPRRRRPLRIAAVLLATLLLHLLAADWGRRQVGLSAPQQPQPAAITIELQPQPAPPSPRPKPKPKPIVKPAPKPRATQPVASPPAPPQPPAPAEPVIAGTQGGWQVDQGTDGNGAGAATAADTAAGGAAPTASAPEPAHRADPPPSAQLKYNVEGLRDGNKVYGKITWQNLGDRYRIDGEASVLFFTLLEFGSDGLLDDSGVSPTLYTEKRFRKSATDTRFEHARNTITFSASDNRYPLPADAQDRASIIWQLAAIGRGDPDAFFAGADFELFVAGVRDAEPWQIAVNGEESVDIDGGPTPAWHLVRLPRPGSYDQKIDIWLAPQRQWYPVRIRYTESNGEYLDMSLSRLTPL